MTSAWSAVRTEVEKLAAEFPNRTAGCFYRDPSHGGPCCIVGVAMDRLGMDVPKVDDFFTVAVPRTEADSLKDGVFVENVQWYQDRNHPWSEAVKRARREEG